MWRALCVLPMLVGMAACSSPSQNTRTAEPARTILYRDGVNVIMSEGSLCVGERPGRAGAWSGQLAGCPYLYGYSARGASDTAPPRRELPRQPDEAANAPVRVAIEDGAGRVYVFALP